MSRWKTLAALVLLAIWLPATQHCALETAGMIALQCPGDCTQGVGQSSDGCGLVESACYKVSGDVVDAPAPFLISSDYLFSSGFLSADFVAPVAVPAGAMDRPTDWVTTWQFVRRAAPPSRAPSHWLA